MSFFSQNTITPSNLCRFHGSARGCKYGNNCNYSHANPQSVPLCKNISLFNTCRYGNNNCMYRHQHSSQSNTDMYIIPLRSNEIYNPYTSGCPPGQSINQWINSQNAKKDGHLLLKSPSIIEMRYGQKLLELIKPLQNHKYNYRHPKFIKSKTETPYEQLQLQALLQERAQLMAAPFTSQTLNTQHQIALIQQRIDALQSLQKSNKLKLQELICQLQHFRQYKQLKTLMRNHGILNDDYKYPEKAVNNPHFDPTEMMNGVYDHMMPMSLCPAIFSLQNLKFLTEINGLLYRDNIELYKLIERIFIQMIPMFERLLNIKLFRYQKQLSVIVKMQDCQFHNECNIEGGWHTAGGDKDDIIAAGLYYFDINSSDGLKVTTNAFEINDQNRTDTPQRVNIKQNDCIVFRNSPKITHRAVMDTQKPDRNKGKDTHKYTTRKMLGFFILNPTINHNANEFKWINFPWKLELFVKYFLDYNMEIYHSIPLDLLSLLKIFTFGDDEYLNKQRTRLQENIKTEQTHPLFPPLIMD